MNVLSQADIIWNRACGEDSLRSHPGDRVLADLLLAHGLAMNGGVLHAVECLSSDELLDAESGYVFMDLMRLPPIFHMQKDFWRQTKT